MRHSHILTGFASASTLTCLLTVSGRLPAQKAAKPIPVKLEAVTRLLALSSRYAEGRVLVDIVSSDGSRRDGTVRAALSSSDPRVATVDERGIVRPVSDGKTSAIAKVGALRCEIPVTVSNSKRALPDFNKDVMPVLTKTGCNMGSCHGAAQGKGGFRLSLQGYDPEADYESLSRGSGVRRVTRAEPESSLLLRKPALAVAHKGGLRLKRGSSEYRILLEWIGAGMPGPREKDPNVARLDISPSFKSLSLGEKQRFRVVARYSDGTARDVTSRSLFSASEEQVAKVSEDGEALATGPGEGAVLVRFENLVGTARVASPYSSLPAALPAPAKGKPGEIDRLVNKKLAAIGLDASPRCTDAEFLRRAFLDLIGLPPTVAEVRSFLLDRDSRKREKLIDSLMDRGEYVDFWSMKWGDLLRSTRRTLAPKGMYALNRWIRDAVRENRPWDEMVREVLLAQGDPAEVGPANFYRTSQTAETMAETASQQFLGVRIQCARCHNHPFEKWTQNQYWRMAAFFARTKSKRPEGSGPIVFVQPGGEVQHPKTKKDVIPAALDARPLAANYAGDRRVGLADWLTAPENPFFARSLVNRVWRHLMGRGLVEPVDDLRVTNPASNEELLAWLSNEFAGNGFDMKSLLRTVMLSETYQRSAMPTKRNARDQKFHSHYLFKRLAAEPLLDSISAATGVATRFDGYPGETRATQLPDATAPSYFLELFGRPARNLTCACERSDDPNLGQILHIMNNAGINGRLSEPGGRIAKLIAAKATDKQTIEELYLGAVSRPPTAEESSRLQKAFAKSKDRAKTAEDLLWALVNSTEFLFNH